MLIFQFLFESQPLESGISNYCAKSSKIHKNFWNQDFDMGQKAKKVRNSSIRKKYKIQTQPLPLRLFGHMKNLW